MKNLRNNKGITLIALIITIIIMLILVGVTVAISLNGGLFETAKEAKTQTEKVMEADQLQAATIAAYSIDTKSVSKQNLQEDLPDWTIEGKEGSTYLCRSPEGNTFTVNQKGEIEDLPEPITTEVPEGWIPLYTADDLAAVASGEENREIQGTTYTMAADADYIVMQNIDLNGYSTNDDGKGFVPIEGFAGNFDGNNHIINNLKQDNISYRQGLFGTSATSVDEAKTIENIILLNADIDNTNVTNGSIGGIINTIQISDSEKTINITNCYVQGTLSAYMGGAGIVNYTNSTIIKDCTVKGNLNNIYAGIISANSGTITIENCHVNAVFITPSGAAGISLGNFRRNSEEL